jgi:glucose-1-phosphate thymidylyltransferase
MPKAVIAIEGGTDERTAPWSPSDPSLLPVANRPLVLHAVDAVRRAGAEEVIVVAEADTATTIRHALGAEADGLMFIELSHPPSSAEAILAAATRLEGERFLLHVGEGMLVRDHGTLSAAIADSESDATVFFHADRSAEPVETKFSLRRRRAAEGEPEHRLAGVHAFGPAFLAALLAMTPDADGRVRIADAVERLADGGGRVQGGVLEDWWRHRGTPEDLLDVNRRVLDEIAPAADALPEDLADARLEGRVHIHPTAHVRNSVVRGPAIIGAHARVTDSYVGPYTSIGDGATIENAEIASSIVLPRARIRHVGVRVEDSIVGPGASVGRDFALPKAMRLLVGSDAQITLG